MQFQISKKKQVVSPLCAVFHDGDRRSGVSGETCIAQGYTLVELLVVIALLILLSTSVYVNYRSYNLTQRLRSSSISFKNDMRLAQNKAVSGLKPESGCTTMVSYRILFSAGSYTLSPVCTPQGPLSAILTVNLPSGVLFQTTPVNLDFQVLTGGVSLAGASQTIVLQSASIRKNYTIVVSQSGDINDQGLTSY